MQPYCFLRYFSSPRKKHCYYQGTVITSPGRCAVEDPEENQETAVESIPVKAGIFDRLKALFSGAAGATVSVLGKLAMMLFALLMPLLLAAYPAYLLSARLLEYSAADTVEAKLTDIDVAMIQIDRDQASLFSARKHFEVIFHFRDGRDQAIEAVVQHPWPDRKSVV